MCFRRRYSSPRKPQARFWRPGSSSRRAGSLLGRDAVRRGWRCRGDNRMTPTRPCTCDRFLPGRPYAAGRDCAKCWLFAHRAAVRRAWGGDPSDCDALFQARPNMSAAELADLLAGPPLAMPDGWRAWPVTRQAHRILADRFLAAMLPFPIRKFSGRGAVLCGGAGYEAGAMSPAVCSATSAGSIPSRSGTAARLSPSRPRPPAAERHRGGRRGPPRPHLPPHPPGLGSQDVRHPQLPL